MPNHFHLVVETPQPNLVAGMKWLLGTYTMRFNRRHRLAGHLFSGRYKALIIDGSANGYLRTVGDYVHLNPARAGLVAADEPLRTYTWSSFPLYLGSPDLRPRWLRVDRLLGEQGIPRDSRSGREEFERRTEACRGGNARQYAPLRRGWFFGDSDLRAELLEQMSGSVGPNHYGKERQEAGEAKAERLVAEELQRGGWSEADLAAWRKGAVEKVRIALRLRRETTVTLQWIARRLHMGSWTHVANRLAAEGREQECKK